MFLLLNFCVLHTVVQHLSVILRYIGFKWHSLCTFITISISILLYFVVCCRQLDHSFNVYGSEWPLPLCNHQNRLNSIIYSNYTAFGFNSVCHIVHLHMKFTFKLFHIIIVSDMMQFTFFITYVTHPARNTYSRVSVCWTFQFNSIQFHFLF